MGPAVVSGLDAFWQAIDDQLDRASEATTVDELLAVFTDAPVDADARGSGHGFFAGSGGDRQVLDVLDRAHWSFPHIEATYWWVAEDHNGDRVTYCEGDLDRGDHIRRPR